MVSLQSALLLPEATTSCKRPRPPCLSLVGGGAVASTATSRKRKRDVVISDDDGGGENSRGEVVDGIELNFDAAPPLPPEWQRCLDIQSGQIHYYNTRTQKRTLKDPRGEPDFRAAAADDNDDDDEEEEESANNRAPPGLDLELNLTFSPRAHHVKKPAKAAAAPPPPPAPPSAAAERRRRRHQPAEAEDSSSSSREMVAAVCVRCHMLVMMCRANPACPNCKFLHTPPTTTRAAPPPTEPVPAPLKLGLQLLC